jgi:capsular polysaccharide biosynthesis protein
LRVACLDGSDREVYREVIKTQQAIEELKAELKEETVPWNVLRMYNVVVKYEC